MGAQAKYMALAGLGQGLMNYGGLKAQEALQQQQIGAYLDRAQSLEEIKQRYQAQVKAEERRYKEEQKQQEHQQELNVFNKGTPEYKANEIKRQQRIADQKAIDAGKKSGGETGIMGRLNLSQWTPDSARKFMAEVNAQITAGKSEEEAYRNAAATTPLVPAPQSGSLSRANMLKAIAEDVAVFKDSGPQGMRMTLTNYGLPEEKVKNMGFAEMVKAYQQILLGEWKNVASGLPGGTIPTGGLMNPGQPQPGADQNNDPLGLRQ
jgi:hypothetical protein